MGHNLEKMTRLVNDYLTCRVDFCRGPETFENVEEIDSAKKAKALCFQRAFYILRIEEV